MAEPRALWEWLNAHTGWFSLGGLVVVMLWNWYKWRQDRALVIQLRERRSKPVKLKATPEVSVLVAAWNEAHIIQEHIESFLRLRYPNKELILCAGGGDDTYEIARRCARDRVVVLEQRPGEGKQRVLWRCLERATGEVIFLTDADCLLNDEAFERTLAPLINEELAASTGNSRPLSHQLSDPFVNYQWAADHYALLRASDTSPGLLGRNCAIKVEVLKHVGAFEPAAPTGTDYVLARQLLHHGYSIRYVRFSAVETEYPTDFSAYFRQRSRWLRNLITIGLKSGDYVQAWYGLRSTILATCLLTMPLLAFVLGPVVLALWASILTYGILARIRYVALHSESSEDVYKPRVAVVGILSLGVDLLIWSGALIQCLVPAWRSRWG